ncbi:Mov34/MPN/PAD-1 family protein [Tolypothrix sp. NIES-4075]|uniref:Mov34/MPN/PAD-1 family protein n=1 Tax=Tolypothrix sp. NIES-4075 TaxID=2005459 RepID=UPI000B5C2C1F|nr:M67 family metallopeptidase [Tolypothrix sp. NIES-4075]GAX44420.1 Mov34/MPN/PAD-1 family protein [Tolypothrix sp. NIES-4075]
MTIKLSQEQLQIIRTHAENTYPQECCGIIIGYMALGKTVVEVMLTENVWSIETAADFPTDAKKDGKTPDVLNKSRRYTIAPEIMLKVQKDARDRSLNIIGIYHSHPDNPAIPSESDRVQAWQEYSYIIVSVPNGKAGELKSWYLDDTHQFQQEAIEIG